MPMLDSPSHVVDVGSEGANEFSFSFGFAFGVNGYGLVFKGDCD